MKLNYMSTASLLVALVATSLTHAPEKTKSGPKAVRLFVRETPITVLGRTIKLTTITQSNGEQGYSPLETEGFHVELVNQLPVPTSIHWHGLILPNLMDGVPFVTEDPVPPGGSRRYDFTLQQSGSYWMHSHYGLQEQQLLSAPMGYSLGRAIQSGRCRVCDHAQRLLVHESSGHPERFDGKTSGDEWKDAEEKHIERESDEHV